MTSGRESATSDSSRASRRQTLGSYTRAPISRVRDRQDEYSSKTLDRTSFSRGDIGNSRFRQGLSHSHDNLDQLDYGGARPKRMDFSLSSREGESSGSEILRELRQNARRETSGFLRKPRERTFSTDSDTSDDQNAVIMKAKSLLDENKARLANSENQILDNGEGQEEVENKAHDISIESENQEEDFEQFKQRLYGTSMRSPYDDDSSAKLKPFSFSESPSIRGFDVSKLGVSRSLDKSNYLTRSTEAVSSADQPQIRRTYNVSEGFKRIDDLFGGSQPEVKIRSRLKKDSSETSSGIGRSSSLRNDVNDRVTSRNGLRGEFKSLRSVPENDSSYKIEKHYPDTEIHVDKSSQKEYSVSNETNEKPLISSEEFKKEHIATYETSEEQLAPPSDPTPVSSAATSNVLESEDSESKRVLIFDGESMVVSENDQESHTKVENGHDVQENSEDIPDRIITDEAMHSVEEISMEQQEMDNAVEEPDDVVEEIEQETEDSQPVIVGSFNSNDFAPEVTENVGDSILSESDSIFSFRKQYPDMDSYFSSKEDTSHSVEPRSPRYGRREIPSFSRSKSTPYETTSRVSRYSSLPTSSIDEKLSELRSRYSTRDSLPTSSIDEKLSELRARYSTRDADADTSSSILDSYQPTSDRTFTRDSWRSNSSRSSLGTSHSSSTTESRGTSVLDKIMNRTFKSIDEYFGEPKVDVVLRRRTSRQTDQENTDVSPKTSLQTDQRESGDTTFRKMSVDDYLRNRRTANTEGETGRFQKRRETDNFQSGVTLQSDVSERESNITTEAELDEGGTDAGTIGDERDECISNVENIEETGIETNIESIEDPDLSMDDQIDDVNEVVELEEVFEIQTQSVESGNIIHLNPEAFPEPTRLANENNIEAKTEKDVTDELETVEIDKDTVLVSEKSSKIEEMMLKSESDNECKSSPETNDENANQVTDGSEIQKVSTNEFNKSNVSKEDVKSSKKSKNKKKDKKKKNKNKKGQTEKLKEKEIIVVESSVDGPLKASDEKSSESERSAAASSSDTYSEKSSSDASAQSKTPSTLRRIFNGFLEAIDHRSDKASVATEDLLSLESSEGITHDNESKRECEGENTLTAGNRSKNGNAVVNKDDSATLEADDISHNGKMLQHQISAEGENFETASETTESGEFYEAIPADLLDSEDVPAEEGTSESNLSVERKEKFVYACPVTKVRKKKIKMKSLLGTSVVKRQAKLKERQRIGQVKAWMENNIFPAGDDSHGVISAKSVSNNQDGAISVETVAEEVDGDRISSPNNSVSKSSKQTIDLQNEGYEMEQVKPVDVASTYTQTDAAKSISRNSGSQTVLKTWNIGVQVQTFLSNARTQTYREMLCPCCKQTIDIQAAFMEFINDENKLTHSMQLDDSQILEKIGMSTLSKDIPTSEIPRGEQTVAVNGHSDITPLNHVSIPTKTIASSTSSSVSTKTNTSSGSSSGEASPTKDKSSPSLSKNLNQNTSPQKTQKSEAKTAMKSRREKVADVKEMLYNNTDIGKSRSLKSPRKHPLPASAKSKSRENSSERKRSAVSENGNGKSYMKATHSSSRKKTKSREPSEDRSSACGSEMSDVPSYMLATKSSSRKSSKSRENSEERAKETSDVKSLKREKSPVKEQSENPKSLELKKKPLSRENSEERHQSEFKRSDLPSYMQATRSSIRKKSEYVAKKVNSEDVDDNENQEHIVSVKENPFVRNDPSKRNKRQNMDGLSVSEKLGNSVKQEGGGKWYRKSKVTAKDITPKKSKSKSPKKARAMSWSGINSADMALSISNQQADALETNSLGSRSSLLETDIDAVEEKQSATVRNNSKTRNGIVTNGEERGKSAPTSPRGDVTVTNGEERGKSAPTSPRGNLSFSLKRPCHRVY